MINSLGRGSSSLWIQNIDRKKILFPQTWNIQGIGGFPKRSESVYDTFGVGHSSTSISAALGMAIANKENDKQHIAVIGDGAMTAGMAFEALNHAGAEKTNLLVILNDNCMSIDPAVGALKEYLTDISTSYTCNKTKTSCRNYWEKLVSLVWCKFKKRRGAVKSTVLEKQLF